MNPAGPKAGTHARVGVEPSPEETDERQLIAAILRRDRKAAARFVACHIDAVHTYVRSRLTPRADLVDDVVQDVFLAGLTGLGAFQGQSSLRTWLLAIARHKIEDIYRQRLRACFALDDLTGAGDEPVSTTPLEECLDRTRVRVKARRILEQLAEHYRLLLLWRYWEQRNAREMATAIGTTEKGVERALARARAKFKELWLKEQTDD